MVWDFIIFKVFKCEAVPHHPRPIELDLPLRIGHLIFGMEDYV